MNGMILSIFMLPLRGDSVRARRSSRVRPSGRTRPRTSCGPAGWGRTLKFCGIGFEGVAEGHALTDGGEGEELFALEAQVVDGEIDAMGGEPGGTAADAGSLTGWAEEDSWRMPLPLSRRSGLHAG